ncbi:MAG: DUF3237 family protein [Lachnospiraceae bacterium]|nr:DUF3237 family protein [Lachnospiraceae bacterium]
MKEILTINVNLTDIYEVKGKSAEAVMINFGGDAKSEFFEGVILPGGVDTQKEFYPERRTLSARYILEGKDMEGEKCRIFIENNGTADENKFVHETTPRIITDSKALSWMETATLKGTLEPKEGGVIIHIFKAD